MEKSNNKKNNFLMFFVVNNVFLGFFFKIVDFKLVDRI